MSPARLGALAALALVALDAAAVPAVLPSARLELGSSSSGLVWMQGGYLLALAVALIQLPYLAASLDRRLLVAAGAALFGAGAMIASGADATSTLVTGRVLQGAGCAALLTVALAGLDAAPSGRRGALLAGAGLLVLALAPLVGGALAEQASWRWLFRLELAPAALALLLFGAGALRDEQAAERGVALAAGLGCATVGLIQSGPWNWGSLDTLVLLAVGAALLAYAWREGIAAPAATAIAVAGSLLAALLLAPQYFELARGLSPLRSGLLTTALTLPFCVLAPLAAIAAGRLGRRRLALAGLACALLGALGATRIDASSSYALVVLSLALLGSGAGASAGALAPPAGRSPLGTVAAGAALVVAAAGALFQEAQFDERDGGGSFEDGLAAGLAGSAWLFAALLAVAAFIAWRRRTDP